MEEVKDWGSGGETPSRDFFEICQPGTHLAGQAKNRRHKMLNDLIIFKKSYDFSKWLFNHTNKFPKSHRFSVAVKIENGMLEFLRCITVANHRKQKLPLLRTADEELISLRIYFRLSHDF